MAIDPVVFELTRGVAVENRHIGAVAVVAHDGRNLYAAGDAQADVFARSALKPFQVLPLIEAGAAADFGFGDQELALCCASHAGEPAHTAGVARMLDRVGCGESDLQCGGAAEATAAGAAGQLAHNCSGKHAGFLAYCRHAGLAVESYLDPGHPLQQRIRESIRRVCGTERVVQGIDGCSAPTYALPLVAIARGYARLAAGDEAALADVFRAMTAYPQLVSGRGRADEFFARATAGNVLAKGGADGVQAFAVRSLKLGVAIKIWDGDARAKHAVGAAVLRHFGLLDRVDPAELNRWLAPRVVNARGTVTGYGRVVLSL